MSGATSMSLVPRHPGQHSSLSSNHRDTFSVPHRSLIHHDSTSIGNASQPHAGTSTSTPTSRLSIKDSSQIHAKNVLFYKSGDTNYESFKVAVTRRNFRTFDALLENLSDKVSLPFGVRTISTPNGTHGISRLDELQDGKAYICSDRKTVKPLNLSLMKKSKPPWFISKPKTRTRRIPTLAASRSAQVSQASSVLPSRYTQVKTPKKVIVVKNGDPTFRHSILLSRRTHQNFEQILEDVAEIFRIKQQRLYTCEGRKVESLQDLFTNGTVFVLAGKESFIPMEYRRKRAANNQSKSDSSTDNATESARMPKELKRTKGRWRVTVTTSELPAAGTDSRVVLTVYGTKGNSGPIPLSHNNATGVSAAANRDKTKKLFMSGNEDEFVVNVGFISDIRKIRICHDDSGKTSPGWLCEEVIMSDLTTGEVLTFPFNRWLSRDEDDGEICRELPATAHDETSFPVFRYIVSVFTGDLWNAGTEANVYLTLYGTFGDSGARLLQVNGKPKALHKGATDVFRFEAVDLGTLQRLVIGHDGVGHGAGWYLEKIVVREDRVGADEHVFRCDRWLDESIDDRKIVRELFIETKPSNSRMRQHSEKSKELELWEQEKWKFYPGNEIMLISKATGKAVRTKPDGSVDGLGMVSHPFGVYKVIRRRGAIRSFASASSPSYHLAVDQNRLLGQGKGGTFCEFSIKVQPDRSIMLESLRYSGHYVNIDPNGKPADTRGHSNSTGRLFNVYVKGCFRNNSVIILNTSATQALVVTGVGDVVGTGKRGDIIGGTKMTAKSPGLSAGPQWANFRVIKVAEGVRMFQCEKNPRRYLRIKDGQCDGLGTGDVYCHFKVQKYKQGAYVTLQSMKHRGVFVGLSSNGKARPTVDTGDSNTQFFPEVIKFGERKKSKAEQYRTPEPSFTAQDVVEASHKRKHSPEKPHGRRKEVALIKTREFGSPGPDEGDYRIYVTTGNSGTKEVVTITAYGDQGKSSNITLGKGHDKGIFQCGQTDEFEANFADIGRLYKIRIGIEEASSNCDWRLKQVKMKDMTTNEIFRFKFNRWISRNRDDGDTLRELPAIVEGAEGELEMLRYHVQVRTSKESSSFSSKKPPIVYLCLFGERGDSGRRLLQKKSGLKVTGASRKDSSRKPFMPNQYDIFEIEAVSLGALTKCSLSCPTSLRNSSKMTSTSSYPAWLCDEIIVKESEGATTEYVFTCKKWLGLKKAGSHATINLALSEVRDIKQSSSSDEADFKDGDWKLCVKTGSHADAGTSASVTFYACGLDGSNSGNVILQGGADGKFEPGKTVKFKVALSDISDLHKVRISHDNDGPDPAWYVESLKLIDPHSDLVYKLPVKKWLAVDRETFQLHTEVPIPKPGVETPRVCTYQVMVYTGGILGSDTDANVYISVYGSTGDSGIRPLLKSKTNATKFQESQMDVFDLDAVSLGELKKIKIGHDGQGPGSGWFLHKVVIKESTTSNKEWIFFCNRWLDHGQDDGNIEREIPVNPEEESVQEKLSDGGEYRVFITTGQQSTAAICPPDAKVTMVVYGEDGKTGEIPIQSLLGNFGMGRKSRSRSQNGMRNIVDMSNCFKSGQTDECKVDIPEIGQIYKIRISHNHLSNWKSWYLEKVVLEDMATKRQLMFPCNRWLSPTEDDGETVREIAAANDGQETLKTILYNVAIYTGDRHGAGTDANAYLLLKGDRGDSGHRCLRKNPNDPSAFQRGAVDMFTVEAVDLGRLVEVIVTHDGEGYGAGWYVEKVTVRAGEFAAQELVFPCNLWLDDSIGDRKISRRLFPIGVMTLDNHEEELEGLGTMSSREGGRDDVWDMNVFVSDVQTHGINRIHLTGVFYGSNGLKASDAISLGEWSTGGRKRMKSQADLKTIGEIYKLRVEMPDYSDSASMCLEYVSMQNLHTREQMQFAFHSQLHSENGSTTKELPAIKPERPLPKITRYLVDVTVVLAKSEHLPEGRLRINLVGDAGDSGYRTLISGLQTFHATEHKDGYVFKLDAVDLGRLSSAVLLYDSDAGDKSEGWIVHSISVSIEDHASASAVPVINSMVYRAHVDHVFKSSTIEEPAEKVYEFVEEQPDDHASYSRKTSSYRREISLRSFRKATEGVWYLTLFYAEEDRTPEGEADDMLLLQDLEKYKVNVQVFGTQSASQALMLSNLNPQRKGNAQGTTDMKIVEACLLLGQDMGTLYLLRFSCTQWDANLVKIKLKDVHTKQEFTYNITESQHKKMENTKINGSILHFDVPLVRPDIPPLEHHKYKITFHTGDLPAAGTDADICTNLYGTHGNTGQRKIDSHTWDAFQRGSIEKFHVETVDVGIPRKISVSHNGAGLGAGWFLEDITVQEQRNERKADYVFQCNKWLDDSVDEKVTQRELYLTGTKFHYPKNFLKPSKGCWKCRLKAKEWSERDNDELLRNPLFLIGHDMKCVWSPWARLLIAKVAFYIKRMESNITLTKTCKFESSEKEFEVNFPEDDLEGGSAANYRADETRDDGFYKIRVDVVNEGNAQERKDWPFEELLMADLDSKEKLHFVFDDAVWDGSSRNIIRELPVMRMEKEPLKLYDYYIMFFTANDSTQHSIKNSEVDVMLSGENGDTGWRQLHKKTGSATNPILQPGKMDMLFAEAVDLGSKVKSVSLRLGAKTARWKLDRIKVKKDFFSTEEFVFEYGRWIEPTAGPMGEVKLDLTSTIISQYPPKSGETPPDDGSVESYEISTTWDIITQKEIHEEIFAKDNFPSLAIKLYGIDGESNLEFLDDKLSSPRGRCTADIQVTPPETLCQLQKIGIGVEGFKENRRSQMANLKKITLLKVTVRNTKTKEYFSFSPGATILENAANDTREKSKESGTNWIELVPAKPKDDESKLPGTIDYTITVKTGNQDEAGTSANVYLTLLGERKGVRSDGGKRWLLCPPDENKFSQGAESEFHLKGVDLGDLKQVIVGHDGNDAKMGWWLESIKVKPSNSTSTYVFLCKKWLANLENDTFIERTLDLYDVLWPETIPKRPISAQGMSSSDQAEDGEPSSRAHTTETLHGSTKNGEDKQQDGDVVS